MVLNSVVVAKYECEIGETDVVRGEIGLRRHFDSRDSFHDKLGGYYSF